MQPRPNVFDAAFQALDDLVVPEPQDLEALALQPGITPSVSGSSMMRTIDLDDEIALEACEIGDERAYRHLPTKAHTELAALEGLPHEDLGVRHRPSKSPRPTGLVESGVMRRHGAIVLAQ